MKGAHLELILGDQAPDLNTDLGRAGREALGIRIGITTGRNPGDNPLSW